jgi:hypothetical protein
VASALPLLCSSTFCRRTCDSPIDQRTLAWRRMRDPAAFLPTGLPPSCRTLMAPLVQLI